MGSVNKVDADTKIKDLNELKRNAPTNVNEGARPVLNETKETKNIKLDVIKQLVKNNDKSKAKEQLKNDIQEYINNRQSTGAQAASLGQLQAEIDEKFNKRMADLKVTVILMPKTGRAIPLAPVEGPDSGIPLTPVEGSDTGIPLAPVGPDISVIMIEDSIIETIKNSKLLKSLNLNTKLSENDIKAIKEMLENMKKE